MASHLRSIVETCHRCGKPAQFALHNTQNARIGTYCRRCALRALKERRAAAGEPPPTKNDMPI